MERLLDTLRASGHRFLLQTYSALDRYYRKNHSRSHHFLTEAPLAFLATLFDEIDYHGTSESDVTVRLPDGTHAFFQCIDSLDRLPERTFTVQHLCYDFTGGYYLDPVGLYPDLRARALVLRRAGRDARSDQTAPAVLRDAALLIARYDLAFSAGLFDEGPPEVRLPVFEQRLLLEALLTSDFPHHGLALLRETGFIRAHWPEIESMAAVPQTKDHHPEGNVLDHALEAFKHRKRNDLGLSLAILLHDLGKTVAEGTRENPYRDHADSGARLARRFLRRLEFPEPLIADVEFLIRHHMMPDALPRMPLYRIERLLASPLFPTLLELFRADILSTFRGPETYYEACRIYRAYQKKAGNPYKTMDAGKPIG